MAETRGTELLQYLIERKKAVGDRLPPIADLARDLGISVAKLREQLEVARQLGLVDIRPKSGIRLRQVDFFQAIWLGLRHALGLEPGLFEQFEQLRNHLEASFFQEAVRLLTAEDRAHLTALVARAWERLHGQPIQIPHAEHRDLHLTIYRRLNNPFLHALLEAYWEAYEAVGLNVYADYGFLHAVWTYHERMVQEIVRGDYQAAQRTLEEHSALVHRRPKLARNRGSAGPSRNSDTRHRGRQGGTHGHS